MESLRSRWNRREAQRTSGLKWCEALYRLSISLVEREEDHGEAPRGSAVIIRVSRTARRTNVRGTPSPVGDIASLQAQTKPLLIPEVQI